MIQFEESIFGAEGETVEVVVTIENYNKATEDNNEEVNFSIVYKDNPMIEACIFRKECFNRIEKKCLNKARNFKPETEEF